MEKFLKKIIPYYNIDNYRIDDIIKIPKCQKNLKEKRVVAATLFFFIYIRCQSARISI